MNRRSCSFCGVSTSEYVGARVGGPVMAGSFVLCVCARAQRTVYLAVVSSKPLRAVGLLWSYRRRRSPERRPKPAHNPRGSRWEAQGRFGTAGSRGPGAAMGSQVEGPMLATAGFRCGAARMPPSRRGLGLWARGAGVANRGRGTNHRSPWLQWPRQCSGEGYSHRATIWEGPLSVH